MIKGSNRRRRSKQIATKIAEHLSKAPDNTVLILKGHLIVEEHINDALRGLFARPEAFDGGRLTYFQKLQVLRAFDRFNVGEHAFGAATLLNRLRNRLAHQLEPIGLDDDVAAFVEELRDWPGSKIKKNESERLKFIRCVIQIGSALDAYRAMYRVLTDFEAGYNAGKEGTVTDINEAFRLVQEAADDG